MCALLIAGKLVVQLLVCLALASLVAITVVLTGPYTFETARNVAIAILGIVVGMILDLFYFHRVVANEEKNYWILVLNRCLKFFFLFLSVIVAAAVLALCDKVHGMQYYLRQYDFASKTTHFCIAGLWLGMTVVPLVSAPINRWLFRRWSN